MKPVYYYGGTLLIYVVEMIGGIFISDIGVLFELSGAFASTALTFFYPALFYLISERKFATMTEKKMNKLVKASAYLYLFLGVFVFVLLMTGNVINLIKKGKSPL